MLLVLINASCFYQCFLFLSMLVVFVLDFQLYLFVRFVVLDVRICVKSDLVCHVIWVEDG